ncbi:MAG TPA: mechanosensitive ion channel domain-containing protein [Flavobacteriales bacterium]|nr:mechanosensitive ion channel domain-containing protein [Flavobacteriales bacterium]
MPEDKTDILTALIKLGTIAGSSLLLFYLLFYMLKTWSRKQKHYIPALVEKHFHLSGFLLVLSMAFLSAWPGFKGSVQPYAYGIVSHAAKIAQLAAFGYFIIHTVSFLFELLIKYYEKKSYKDYTLRRAKTKFILIKRILHIVVIIVVTASIISTFEQARQLGTTLMASAGIAGIVIGFAAQKSLGTLFSGIQIAITQPIKLDDTVVVENQFGTIGEITLTYVVVNTWDGKRLIVPINYFLEKTFENWTRISPEIVAQVKVYSDYTLPVADVRKKVEEWLTDNPLWDKRRWNVLVTGSDDKTMTVRATMSAKDSDDAWDLECQIREKLITYIQENYPASLPVSRLRELHNNHK